MGCEKYGTEIMRKSESLLFVEAAVESGSSIEEAFKDMLMIDACLKAVQLHRVIGSKVKYTSAGNLRKDAGLRGTINAIVGGRVEGAF